MMRVQAVERYRHSVLLILLRERYELWLVWRDNEVGLRTRHNLACKDNDCPLRKTPHPLPSHDQESCNIRSFYRCGWFPFGNPVPTRERPGGRNMQRELLQFFFPFRFIITKEKILPIRAKGLIVCP